MPTASGKSLFAQNLGESLPSTPQHLIELKLRELHRLANRNSRFLTQIEALEHLTVARHRQLGHELAHALCAQIVIQRFLERLGIVLQVGEQLAVALVPPGKLPTPISCRELACRSIQIASEVARIFQPFRADLFDRLQKGSLEQILSRVSIDAPLEEYLHQGAPISHIERVLQLTAAGYRGHESGIPRFGSRAVGWVSP